MLEVTAESIFALMPHKRLTKLDGEPFHKTFEVLKRELGENLMAVECPWGHGKGHLGLLQRRQHCIYSAMERPS